MKTQKYRVKLFYRYVAVMDDVEAESEAEAIDIAEAAMDSGEIQEEFECYLDNEAKVQR